MTTRRELLIALAGALAAPLAAVAQRQPAKIARIGFLGATSAAGYAAQVAGLRRGLREFGYEEARNIAIEFRWAEGRYERLPGLAAELVRAKVDVIVTHGAPGVLAAKQATSTIPIVMGAIGDAVAVGVVPNLARPGGNITGSTFFVPELMVKRLELIKETVPRIARVAALVRPDNPMFGPTLAAMESAARLRRVEVQQYAVRQPSEFEEAFAVMARNRADAAVVQEDASYIVQAQRISSLALKRRLPLCGFKEIAETGGLLAYGVDIPAMFYRAAYFVDKILKGARPADLPIEQSTRFNMLINQKTAKALGVRVPQSILVRADRVIE